MGEICGFSLEFVVKYESTKRNRVEMDDKECFCVLTIWVFEQNLRNKNYITEKFLSLFQVSGVSRSDQTSNPLDTLSSLVKKSGSRQHFFTSWQHKPKKNRTISEDSVEEEDHVKPPVKIEGSGETNKLHTCSLHAPSQCDKSAMTPDNLSYEAESPDEAALVYAAKAYGFTLLARTPDSVTVRLPSGEDLVFQVLDTLTFDYNRKRMSVLVRHPITKEYVLYTKGADHAIMELLATPYAGMCR